MKITTKTEPSYRDFSPRKLISMLDSAEKQRVKLNAEIKRLWSKMDKVKERKSKIASAIAEQEQLFSDEVLEAIEEIRNGGGILFKDINEYKAKIDE